MRNMDGAGCERKVRFTLPNSVPDNSKIRRHVVGSYRNGCLINVVQPPNNTKTVSILQKPIKLQFPISSSFDEKVALKRAQKSFIPDAPRRSSSTVFPAPAQSRIEELKKRHTVVVTDPPKTQANSNRNDPANITNICNRISRLMLVDDIIASKPPPVAIPIEAPPPRFTGETYPRHKPTARRIANSLFNADTNSRLVADLVNRWHRMRHREKLQSREKLLNSSNNGCEFFFVEQTISNERRQPLALTDSSASRMNAGDGGAVSITRRLRTDARRFGSFKMSLESDPNVTTLLRAAREADEELLKIVLRKILIDGISKEALNSADKSGRTAISYICSTNLTNFLDIMLQIPGIDVNKPDNEGNTPLHFAAQAGQADTVNMLITRSRSLQIDAKNCLGFTPLMKAALQGRTRCAKLLLFAGASSVETDYGRGLRAEEWAIFCGRPSCAEIIEKFARARLLEKTQSCRTGTTEIQKLPVVRSKTTTIQTQIGETFRTKFRKFLPFGASVKDKQNMNRVTGHNNNNTDIVGYLRSATICASGPALPAEGKAQMMHRLTKQQFDVPKVEVTPANNQHLIKKYEQKMNYDQPDISIVKQSPSIRY